MESVLISLQFENKISAYPTQVKITDERGIVSLSEYQELEETLMRNIDLVDILQNLLAKKDEQQELMDIVENE
ncbi:hypothetical protein G6F56_004647 [Rhizopus delemar]|nr:hypothetical protein G6F56_004647 [Rhizopus delemar]